jgi:hypothetical protein
MQYAGRLVRFSKETLQLIAQLIRALVVLMLEDGFANGRERVLGSSIVAVLGTSRPQGVFIERERFRCRIDWPRIVGAIHCCIVS